MKNLLIPILFGFFYSSTFAQNDIEWRVIPSLTDWINEINTWPDSTYKVSNIRIMLDLSKDSLMVGRLFPEEKFDSSAIAVKVNKMVDLTNWQVMNIDGRTNGFSVKNIHFSDEVIMREYEGVTFNLANILFEKRVVVLRDRSWQAANFNSCYFRDRVGFYGLQEESRIGIRKCIIINELWTSRGRPVIRINDSELGRLELSSNSVQELLIRNSKIKDVDLQNANIETTAHLLDSEIDFINVSGAHLPNKNTYIPFDQIKGKIYVIPANLRGPMEKLRYKVSDTIDFNLKEQYDLLVSSYKLLQDGYQNRGNQDSYNACYMEMKDLETRRLAFLYETKPNFKTFFTWKINQFLRTFSSYGTEPARSIIYSMYVILFFALIYLFFPNSWDSHGRNRIIDRYKFFFKYLNRNAGIHEVYLEEKQTEMLTYEEFKKTIAETEKKVPKFFTWSAYPLYKWAISGTQLTAGILRRMDILQGTWTDLPEERKWWKGLLLTGAFIIALIYDLIIKMLNALMLSINTFTTLGFGEIPIKGLPRYLAIIEGFIGWFMLTIFSVSLISQLLN